MDGQQQYLLAEDLLLLLLDDERGTFLTDTMQVDDGLAGAILLELALLGRVRVREGSGSLGGDVVTVQGDATTEDDLLDDALATIGAKPRTATGVVQRLAPGLRRQVLDRLEARGLLEHEQGRLLGIFPRDRWPSHDDRHEMSLRARLRDVLVLGHAPDERMGALVALLHAIGAEHRVLPFPGISDRAMRKRARQLSDEATWASQGVHDAVDVVTATAAALRATTIAASSTAPGGG